MCGLSIADGNNNVRKRYLKFLNVFNDLDYHIGRHIFKLIEI